MAIKRKSRENSKADADLEIPETPASFFRTATMGQYYKDYARTYPGKVRLAVTLEPDVARVFRSDAEVNEALRLVQKMREIGKNIKGKRKSA